MGKIIIQEETTKNPIQLIGKEAGVCWGADIFDETKNYKRGLDCLQSGHGRTWEYPQIYMILDGYSAKVIREFYTHIGGASSRLQASTRYIKYQNGFHYIVPPSIDRNEEAYEIYQEAMHQIHYGMKQLDELGIPKEDSSMLLPLGMETKVVCRMNARTAIDMSHQRLCTRAYWEYRFLMLDLMRALSEYSEEWKYIVENYFKPKCEVYNFCTEKYCCGRKPRKVINNE